MNCTTHETLSDTHNSYKFALFFVCAREVLTDLGVELLECFGRATIANDLGVLWQEPEQTRFFRCCAAVCGSCDDTGSV